jgi:hypothetical protein
MKKLATMVPKYAKKVIKYAIKYIFHTWADMNKPVLCKNTTMFDVLCRSPWKMPCNLPCNCRIDHLAAVRREFIERSEFPTSCAVYCRWKYRLQLSYQVVTLLKNASHGEEHRHEHEGPGPSGRGVEFTQVHEHHGGRCADAVYRTSSTILHYLTVIVLCIQMVCLSAHIRLLLRLWCLYHRT